METILTAEIKYLLGLAAIGLTFIAFIPYISSIMNGQTKPHVFSWVIWGLTTFIVFIAQIADNGGAGAWCTGVSGIVTMYIAWLAYSKKADINITRSDWGFFIAALASIPLWYLTSNPLWAVVILTVIDILGFAPTIRKTYFKPHDEQLTMYGIITARNGLSIIALENYSFTTILFPAAVGVACVGFIVMLLYRRKILARG